MGGREGDNNAVFLFDEIEKRKRIKQNRVEQNGTEEKEIKKQNIRFYLSMKLF